MSASLRPPAHELRYVWLGEAFVDLTANQLVRQGCERRLTPKATAVLRELMLRPNQVVRRDDLLGLVWNDGFPTDDVLTHAIRELRRALGDDPRSPQQIETIPRVGYRLRASLRIVAEPPPEAALGGGAANDPLGFAAAEATDVSEASSASSAMEPAAPPAAMGCPPAVPAAAATPPQRTAGRTRRRAWMVAALLSVLALFATLPWPDPTPPAPEASPLRAAQAPPTPIAITSEPGKEYFPALSPDGSMVAYASAVPGGGQSALRIKGRDPAATSVVLVQGPAGHFFAHPVWSPDGGRIAFQEISSQGCSVRVVPASGGQAQTVAGCDKEMADGIDWSPDGDALYLTRYRDAAGTRGLARLSLDSGEVLPLDYRPHRSGDLDLLPRVSPDGRWIAFRRGDRPHSDLWIVPREGGSARRIAASASGLRGHAWSADSASVVISSDHAGMQSLYRVPIDGSAPEALGIDNAHYPSVARRGGFLGYHQSLTLMQFETYDLDDSGQGSGRLLAPASRSDFFGTLSPDGERLAFVSERSGSPQVWLHDFSRGETAALTASSDSLPDTLQWSPDARALLFARRSFGQSRLVRLEVDSGRESVLTPEDELVRSGSYAADGDTVFYSSRRSGAWELWRMRGDGSGAVQLTRSGGIDPSTFPGSPHVYYAKPSTPGLFRMPVAGGDEEQVSALREPMLAGNYRVHQGELWIYSRDLKQPEGQLLRRPVEGGIAADAAIEIVARFSRPGAYPALAAGIDPARGRVVATMVMRDATDVFVVALD